MNIFGVIREEIIAALEEMIKAGDLPDDVSLDAVTSEPPRDASHGDIATNAAMVVAKKAGKNPREIAESLASKLNSSSKVKNTEVAGPGFININLEDEIWHDLVKVVLDKGESFGDSDIGGGQKVNVEYVSVNPTGPMHIGHARNAVVGDVLALLMIKAGYDVIKEYYINDAGAQIDKLARSAYLRYCEAAGDEIGEIPEGLYPGEYLKAVGEEFFKIHERHYLDDDEEHWMPVMREFAVERMMDLIREDLLKIGVEHEIFTSEKKVVDSGAVDEVITFLDHKKCIYQGVLEPPKGMKPDDWEAREQTLFRSTDFGDDVDRALKKSDGSHTYFASDIAYHFNKINRGFNNMIVVLGADHGGYVKRMKAAVSSLSDDKAKINMILCQLVSFLENGEPMKMSKRAGTFVTVRDVVEAVGKDVVRFMMLTRKTDATLDFDLKKVTEQSKDNPVFYVQYSHARAQSVLRNAKKEVPEIDLDQISAISKEEIARITDPSELALVRTIAQWPRLVESAALAVEPHRVAFYLQELAAEFHSLWNLGKDNDDLRFIINNDLALTKARLAMVKAFAITISSGLKVMGVEPVMEM